MKIEISVKAGTKTGLFILAAMIPELVSH